MGIGPEVSGSCASTAKTDQGTALYEGCSMEDLLIDADYWSDKPEILSAGIYIYGMKFIFFLINKGYQHFTFNF